MSATTTEAPSAAKRRQIEAPQPAPPPVTLAYSELAATGAAAKFPELSEDDIKACIVPAAGAQLDAEELFAFFRSQVPYYAVPRYVEVLDALPANVNGRVQKFLLRERGVAPRRSG